MRLLVTGASGNLGRVVRKALESRGDLTVSFAVGPRHAPTPDELALDLRDPNSIADVVDRVRPDVVVHLAGLIGQACELDLDVTRVTNVDAVGSLASLALSSGATRFIFASSAAVYGAAMIQPASENAALDGASSYARSKIAAEGVLRELAANYDSSSILALRIFNIYGPGFSDSLVERLRRSTPEHPVPVAGATTFVRDYIHVEDVAAAIVASCVHPLPLGFTPMNIASGLATSTADLITALSGRAQVHVTLGDGAPSMSAADVSLAREVLGLEARELI